MSRIEIFIEKIKKSIAEKNEAGRIEEMRNHPHFRRCDGSGRVVILERTELGGNGFEPYFYGTLTQCTSCKATKGSGLLHGEGFFDKLNDKITSNDHARK